MKNKKKTDTMKNVVRIIALAVVLLTLAVIPIMVLGGY